LVTPVFTADGEEAVLKLTFTGDEESRHEAETLQHWRGTGAVRLLRAGPGRRALLLERLHRRDLTTIDDVAACEVVAKLYLRLHRDAMPQLVPVTSYVDRWLAALAELDRDAPIPRRYVEQALHLGRGLVSEAVGREVIIHGDLHYQNVLAADRATWLAIDPKPMSGDSHYEPAPMLWNRWDEVVTDVRAGVRRRFHALVDAAGLDEDRARSWVIVRMVLNAHWSIQDAARAGRRPDAGDRDWISRCVAVVKAVQD
jgi:streptomycin 6-kinase